MNTLALTAANMGIGGSGIAAVLGYVVVFFGLVLLMCVVILLGKALAGRRDKFVLQSHLCSIWEKGQYLRTRDIPVR